MKTRIIIIFLIISSTSYSQSKYWEDLTKAEKQKMLDYSEVTQFAKDFFYDNYKIDQDSLLIRLLETISLNRNTQILPLYYFILIKFNDTNNSCIRELYGWCCVNFLLNHSEFVINHIRIEIENGQYIEYKFFNESLEYEYYATEPEEEYENRPTFNNLKKKVINNSANSGKGNIDLATGLLTEIETEINKVP